MKGKDEFMSLNENMKADLSIQQLEERLETDPLALGGLLDIPTPDAQVTCFVFECGNGFKLDL